MFFSIQVFNVRNYLICIVVILIVLASLLPLFSISIIIQFIHMDGLSLKPLAFFHGAHNIGPNFDIFDFLLFLESLVFALHKSHNCVFLFDRLIQIKCLVEINQVPIHNSDRFHIMKCLLPLLFGFISQTPVIVFRYGIIIFLRLCH